MSLNTGSSSAELDLGLSSHNNQYLFSDYFLNNILKKERPWEEYWQKAVVEARQFLAWVSELYQQEQTHLPHYNESQLEDHWFRPILERLGHIYEGQAQIPGFEGGVKYPDYIFFPDEPTRQQALQSAIYTQHALMVGEVKKWDVHLGKKNIKGENNFDNSNPMFQIAHYVNLTNLKWGLLSNGRLWRLVHHTTSYKLDVYLEIDLIKAIEQQNLAIATFFVLFFQQPSFKPDKTGRVFIDSALMASTEYTAQLEEDLRNNAYVALEYLMQGFFAPTSNELNYDHLMEVYNNALYLLYRIIFLFYGESRGLLPMASAEYQRRSLTKLAREICQALDEGRKFPPMTKIYAERLKELFMIINGTDIGLNQWLGVPRYNGGLFKPELHPFLEQKFVGDHYLTAALDVLARREVVDSKNNYKRENVDYRTLSVRQIGSVYEGLLEYEARLAMEDMVVIERGLTQIWIPVSQKPKGAQVLESRPAGSFYLATDNGERKSTGSYYTPDYIVKYMVESCLAPQITQIKEQIAQQGGHKQELFVQEILNLTVLDPAMGSGHFLVEATDFLARAITSNTQVQVAADKQTAEDDLVLWRRQIVERCIYGVDNNPMAVELAKLSLWLVTVASDKPLSFLDHHLRYGDSLVGARLADLTYLPQIDAPLTPASPAQLQLFDESALTRDVGLAVGGMARIGQLPSDDIETVYAKEATFKELKNHLNQWRTIANLWVSHFFGNEMPPAGWPLLLAHLQGQPTDPEQMKLLWPHLDHPLMQKNDFFHWELEFPEIFFDEYGRPKKEAAGFDVVLGNPPYARIKKPFLKQFVGLFCTTCEYQYDLFVAFMELAIGKTKIQKDHAFIVPTTFLVEHYFGRLRNFLLQNTQINKILHFKYLVFDEAIVESAIYQLNRQPAPEGHFVKVGEIYAPEELREKQLQLVPQKLFSSLPGQDLNVLITSEKGQIVQRLLAAGLARLKDVASITVGIKPYQVGKGTPKQSREIVQKRVFDASSKQDETYKSYLVGQDIQRYKTEQKRPRWLSYGPWLAEPRASAPFFKPKKLLIRQTSDSLIVTLDKTQQLTLNNLHNLEITHSHVSYEYLLALLNSKLLTQIHQILVPEAGRVFAEVKIVDLHELPIVIPTQQSPAEERTAATQTASQLYEQKKYNLIIIWAETELASTRSDTVHDFLAYLAQQMLTLNHEKQSRIAQFWEDLSGVTDEKTFQKLYGKAKQEKNLYGFSEVFHPFVDPTSTNPISLEQSLDWNVETFKLLVKAFIGRVLHLSQWTAVYRHHYTLIEPLNHQLAQTDQLIDQLVYRLYGLTPTEIAFMDREAA